MDAKGERRAYTANLEEQWRAAQEALEQVYSRGLYRFNLDEVLALEAAEREARDRLQKVGQAAAYTSE